MDERELGELFRETPGHAPPASFDADDVLRGSRRVTAQRRMALAGGSFVTAAVLVVGTGYGTGLFGGTSGEDANPVALPPASPSTSSPDYRQSPMSLPGDGACATPDQQVAQAVARQVPVVANTAPTTASECPEGARGAAYLLDSGKLSVVVAPASAVPAQQFGETTRPDGSVKIVQRTASGKVLTLLSNPDEDAPAPESERLPEVAEALAGSF